MHVLLAVLVLAELCAEIQKLVSHMEKENLCRVFFLKIV